MKNGFTLIEMMICVAIVGIITTIVMQYITDTGVGRSDGTVCRGGYLFDYQSNRQLIGINGGGVPCGNQSTSNQK